jgi:preprotein translocase subunit SecA
MDRNEREVQRLAETVKVINALEPDMKRLTDAQLRDKTDEFRARIAERRDAVETAGGTLEDLHRAEQEILDQLLPEAFAAVREASMRTLGQRHYDVQMMGGIVLHQGRIAEMRTGEGKTLVSTLPLYLNALLGRGVHLVTHNDYLAKRDAVWNGQIFHLLGLSVGILQSAQSSAQEGMQPSYVYDPTFNEDDHHFRHMRQIPRIDAYRCDICYGIHSEYGFDYLRDNMVHAMEQLVQRELYFAIVDEVDSILIDEARTPLIISGIPEESTELYYKVDRAIAKLEPERHFTVDEKHKTAMLTDDGTTNVEQILGVKNVAEDVQLMHHLSAALKARHAYKRDVDYVVKDGEVIIVDEFTGRLMFGRRYSDGLHQAIEAKENVKIEAETQTVATITYQNYFRLYEKLAGMTGTAKTEEDEFAKIYTLNVVVIPTNLPMVRKDHKDVIWKTEEAKFRGITAEILQKHTLGQPVLVGSRSIEVSERLGERLLGERLQMLQMILLCQRRLAADKSLDKETKNNLWSLLFTKLDDLWMEKLRPAFRALQMDPEPLGDANIAAAAQILEVTGHEERLKQILKDGIPRNILNAKYHEREAEIIADAGKPAQVTIATNMAGRGVDILLGGRNALDDSRDKEAAEVVKSVGGLHIIGSERHESRRIDNQLRGRAGRQGDPGSSRFHVCLEDELWRLFGDRGRGLLEATWDESEPIEHGILTRAIERAQKRVEENNFSIRKHVLEYDDVMNLQREVIYASRRRVLEGEDLRDTVVEYLENCIEGAIGLHCGDQPAHEWDLPNLYNLLAELFPIYYFARPQDLEGKDQATLQEYLLDLGRQAFEMREKEVDGMGGESFMRYLERQMTLYVVDEKWVGHLQTMDYLKEGINLRAYAQQDPLVAFKKEAYEYFQELMDQIQRDVVRAVFHARVVPEYQRIRQVETNLEEDAEPSGNGNGATTATGPRFAPKVGRNDPCPCGSGKKYKKCCIDKDTGGV